MAELEHWDNFYLITGGAAGALIGLQFVVITLIAGRPVKGATEATHAFFTPTIVQFSACLLLSALMLAPWPTAMLAAWAWGAAGLVGLLYSMIVALRLHRQRAYRPDHARWLFQCVVPSLAYLILLLCAPYAQAHEGAVLFVVGASALILLFTGIHNSWNIAVFISTGRHEPGARLEAQD